MAEVLPGTAEPELSAPVTVQAAVVVVVPVWEVPYLLRREQ